MDGPLPLPAGRGTEVSCPFWDRIHTSLKSIKWVTGEGTGKVSSLSAHCFKSTVVLGSHDSSSSHHMAGTTGQVN